MNRIQDYALIGDCHSVALVGRDGSVDWCCFPRMDSPAVFARILDAERGGFFRVSARGMTECRREYVADTNVLVTRHAGSGGELEITDCMPTARFDAGDPGSVSSSHAILRRVRAVSGPAVAEVALEPRFEYGAFTPRFTLTSPHTAEIVGGADALWVRSSRPLSASRDALHAEWKLEVGEEAWIEAAWSSSHDAKRPPHAPSPGELSQKLEDTIAFWRAWLAQSWYDGEHAGHVRRSALALKALTYAPTGAVVAAPTTSLPEEIGSGRNWDYRYTWIRDATLTLTSMMVLGFRAEAERFKTWLERTGAGRPEDLQIMYRIRGERFLPEVELGHLSGHRSSAPVRIGNGAAKQLQLDSYGQILEAAHLFSRVGGDITTTNWSFLSGLVDIVCDRWRFPDHGIWEIRDEPRHFVHSKLNCWVALDRGVKLARARNLPAPLGEWEAQRDALFDYLVKQGAPNGWFCQAAGHEVPDASVLLVPALGLLPTTHPLIEQTLRVIERDLARDGLVYRYLSPDGLSGGEGAFLLCSFWLLDCLTHSGRLDEAEALLERLLGLGNDVGLYAEEVEPHSGEALGNFPQAFTHMALVASAAHLAAAKRGEVPFNSAVDYAELALERLLAASAKQPLKPGA